MKKLESLFENKIFLWCVIVATTIFGAIYYYGIVNSFAINGEEVFWVYNRFLEEKISLLHNFYFTNDIIYLITSFIAYMISGFSLETVRIGWTLRYALILLLTVIIVVKCGKSKYEGICTLPIVVILMIEMAKISYKSDFGFIDAGQDVLTNYPSNYHATALIVSLLCTFLMYKIVEEKNRNTKTALIVLLLSISIYYIKLGDIILFADFIIPLMLYGLFKIFYNEKYRIHLNIATFVALGFLIITKVLNGTSIHNLLWSSAYTSEYNTGIYGNTSWANVFNITSNIDNLFKLIVGLFNLDRHDMTIVSVWSIVLAVRIVLVITGFVLAVRIIISNVSNKMDERGYDVVDCLCAYGLLILCAAKLLTTFNYHNNYNRYFFSMVPLLTIIVTRNARNVINSICSIKKIDSFQSKLIGLVIGTLIMILGINNVYAGEKIDSDTESIQQCIDYIVDNGEGYAIAPVHIYARMAAQAGPEHVIFFFDINEMHKWVGDNVKPRYCISNYDEGLNQVYRTYYETEQEMIDAYGKPIKKLEFGNIHLYQFW